MFKQKTDRNRSKNPPVNQNVEVLRNSAEQALNNYFTHLDGQTVTGVYKMVLTEIEVPLFTAVMKYTEGNQTKAAELLGLNRGTLRKKLQQYKLI